MRKVIEILLRYPTRSKMLRNKHQQEVKNMTVIRGNPGPQNMLVVLLAVLLLIGGASCGPTQTPTPVPPTATSTAVPTATLPPPVPTVLVNPPEAANQIKAGDTVGISVQVSGAFDTIEGEAAKGKLERATSSSFFYTAPSDPGPDVVTIVVKGPGGKTSSSVNFNVVPRPTDTPPPPTKIPTATLSVTATPRETPTSETPPVTPSATAAPTETPTPACQSFRPPIVGTTLSGQVKIDTPPHCATDLPHENMVAGSYSGVPDNLDLWVLVYPPDMKYYPQSTDACKELPAQRASGRWLVRTYLGRVGVSEQFDIVAVVANADASAFFKQWLRTGCDTDEYPGLDATELPKGIMEKDSITVQTAGTSP